MIKTCRDCNAEIRWAVNEAGKNVPLDPDPVDDGELVLTTLNPGGDMHVRYVRSGETLPSFTPRYKSHFGSCVALRKKEATSARR